MSASAINNQNQIRVQIDLPVRNGNKEKWDTFAVKWLEPFDNDPFLVRAELPLGWNVKEIPEEYLDKKSFVVLDASGKARVDVWMKTSFYDQFAKVRILSKEEGIKKEEEFNKPGQEEFDLLLDAYYRQIQFTAGCGSRAQGIVDQAYKKLEDFVQEHPEFAFEMPKKHKCRDDGAMGSSGSFGDAVQRGECSVM